MREEDVQVLHGFDSVKNAKAYLDSDMFKNDVVTGLAPLFEKEPCIKIFEVVA